MSRSRDELDSVRQAKLLEELGAVLRHDVRNKFAAIRNMMFYINRKIKQTDVYTSDPRIVQFVALIGEEIEAADELLGLYGSHAQRVYQRESQILLMPETIARAVRNVRVDNPDIFKFEVEAEAGEVEADENEIAYSICALIENAAEAMPGGGTIRVKGSIRGDEYAVAVYDSGPGLLDQVKALQLFHTTKPGHIGLGLNVAARTASRASGKLEIGAGVAITFARAGTKKPKDERASPDGA